jgi:hypothetical protein
MNGLLSGFICLLVSLVATSAYGGGSEMDETRMMIVDHGHYRLIFRGDRRRNDTIEIWRDGQLVDRIEDLMLLIDNVRLSDRTTPPAIVDVTGDGKSNLVVNGWGGGAYCCLTFHVVELDDPYRVIFRESLNDGLAYLDEVDGRPGLEMRLLDDQFVLWRTTFVHSRMPEVILCFDGALYRPDPELMRRPGPDEQSLKDRAAAARDSEDWERWRDEGVTPEVTNTMSELIYTGHYDRAEQFMHDAWPADRADKKHFWDQFRCHLQSGPFWPGVAILNGFDDPLPLPEDCDDGGNHFF